MKLSKFLPLLAMPLFLLGCNEDATYPFKLGLGGPDVPVGQYSSQILEHFGINEADLAEKGYISYGSNVKEVTTQVLKRLYLKIDKEIMRIESQVATPKIEK